MAVERVRYKFNELVMTPKVVTTKALSVCTSATRRRPRGGRARARARARGGDWPLLGEVGTRRRCVMIFSVRGGLKVLFVPHELIK